MTVDDDAIVARPLGRSGRSGAAPLLMIGFWPEGEEGPEHVREALVVARDFAALSDDALTAAWRSSREPPAAPGAPPRRGESRGRR
jgi:hypothetical protein